MVHWILIILGVVTILLVLERRPLLEVRTLEPFLCTFIFSYVEGVY